MDARSITSTVVLALLGAFAVFAMTFAVATRTGDGDGDGGPVLLTNALATAAVPRIDIVQWQLLRGGAVPDPTPMSPPTRAPRITERLVPQYRAGGALRVWRDRPTGFQPRAIVLHATGSGEPGTEFASLGRLQRFFARPAARASSHYAVDRQGRIMRFVADDDAAFHVATPGWNDISIGIELLNDNTGAQPFPPAQLRAATQLVRWLGVRYRIPVEGVTRHRTIQPADRRDPAGNFPWLAWLRTLAAPPT